MFFAKFAPLLLLPYAASAAGVHKLRLKKLPQTLSNQHLETAYLAEKYGAQPPAQMPLLGSKDTGRRMRFSHPGHDDDDLFWTQEEEILANGGHSVPLTSKSLIILVAQRLPC